MKLWLLFISLSGQPMLTVNLIYLVAPQTLTYSKLHLRTDSNGFKGENVPGDVVCYM